MTTAIRVDSQLAATLRALSIEEGRPISQVIEDALSQYQKEKFWREVENSVERLRANPVAWKEYQDEIRFFEGGSTDRLENEESYYTKAELGHILGQ